MTKLKEHYATLGIDLKGRNPSTISEEEIKKAYRKLTVMYHEKNFINASQ